VSERTGQEAPLWRIRYDNATIGEEDLEMFEVEEAVMLYESNVTAPQHQHPSARQELAAKIRNRKECVCVRV
jgi:hypothetical protein